MVDIDGDGLPVGDTRSIPAYQPGGKATDSYTLTGLDTYKDANGQPPTGPFVVEIAAVNAQGNGPFSRKSNGWELVQSGGGGGGAAAAVIIILLLLGGSFGWVWHRRRSGLPLLPTRRNGLPYFAMPSLPSFGKSGPHTSAPLLTAPKYGTGGSTGGRDSTSGPQWKEKASGSFHESA